MQSADPASLFQTDASLATGLKRALKWKHASQGPTWGSPLWLADLKRAPPASAVTGKVGGSVEYSADDQIERDEEKADAVAFAQQQPPIQQQQHFSSTSTPRESETLVNQQVTERAARGAAFDAGSSKVLAMEVDADEGVAYVAEAGGAVRMVDLETGALITSFRAGIGPCFCLCRSPDSKHTLLATGSWDKTIRIYLVPPSSPPSSYYGRSRPLAIIPNAASDLLKSLGFSPHQQVLFSGGSDLHVRAWDLKRLFAGIDQLEYKEVDNRIRIAATKAGSKQVRGAFDAEVLQMGAMREHTRPVTRIVTIPTLPPPFPAGFAAIGDGEKEAPRILTADSMGRLFETRVEIDDDRSGAATTTSNSSGEPGSSSTSSTAHRCRFVIERELRGHETSITDVQVVWRADEVVLADEDEDGEEQVRWTRVVWSASNDKSVKRFDLDADSALDSAESRAKTKARDAAIAAAAAPARVDRISKGGAAVGRKPPLLAAQTISHADFVKAVLPLPTGAVQENDSLLIAGSADEDLYVWDVEAAAGASVARDERRRDVRGNAMAVSAGVMEEEALVRRQRGHWHEVSALGLWKRKESGALPSVATADGEANSASAGTAATGAGWWVVSASYDGSIRRWPLKSQLLQRASSISNGKGGQSEDQEAMLDEALQKAVREGAATATTATMSEAAKRAKEAKSSLATKATGMTAEEEAELAELLSDEDD